MAAIASTDIEISTYQRLHPRAYLAKFIAEKLRPDGRELAEFRLLEINSGYCQDPIIRVGKKH
jgi:exosome complex component RRP43